MTGSRVTIILGSLALVAVIALSWLFVLSGRMAESSDIDARTTQVAAVTEQTLSVVSGLEQDAERLPDVRKKVARLTEEFPSTAAQPTLLVMVRDAALRAGIAEPRISDLTPSVPVLGSGTDGAVTLAPDAAPAPAEAEAPAGGEAPVEDPSVVPAPVAPLAAPDTLATMTVTISVTGSAAQILEFVDNLENMDRAYLVSQLTYGVNDGEERTLSVTGSMFMLPEIVDPEDVPAGGSAD